MKQSIFKLIFIILISFGTHSCIKETNETNDTKNTPNKLIGTWRYDQKNGSYWYELKFNSDLSGNRKDADNENDNFTYTFTDSEINFTSGFPNGKFNYKIFNDSFLMFDGDTLKKKNKLFYLNI